MGRITEGHRFCVQKPSRLDGWLHRGNLPPRQCSKAFKSVADSVQFGWRGLVLLGWLQTPSGSGLIRWERFGRKFRNGSKTWFVFSHLSGGSRLCIKPPEDEEMFFWQPCKQGFLDVGLFLCDKEDALHYTSEVTLPQSTILKLYFTVVPVLCQKGKKDHFNY